MTMDQQKVLQLAQRAIEAARVAGATDAEALVMATDSALTRFANNRIHQNVATSDTAVSIRAVIGRKIGVASTNRGDDASLREACEAAVVAARVAPEDPDFPGLPAPAPTKMIDRSATATRDFGPARRAEAVASIVSPSASRGFTAAGTVSSTLNLVAVASSTGVASSMPYTRCAATVLSTGDDAGTGWASWASRDASEIRPDELGLHAADIAASSAHPQDLEPGDYPVVLSPEAVSDMLQFLGWFGLGAKQVEEGRSFMSDHIGEIVMSPSVSITDDALADDALGLTFDFEGQPKSRIKLIDRGVAVTSVTDSRWAAKTGRANTGHALPAPNSYGPLPLDLAMDAGDSSREKLIASVERGVYVTRFHYVNMEDPIRATLTGMTRDGTFLIENGELTRPLKSLRFTQSAVEALASVRGISAERVRAGEDANALAPWVALDRFAFTGQTS